MISGDTVWLSWNIIDRHCTHNDFRNAFIHQFPDGSYRNPLALFSELFV
jgi:hypothetical protein